MFCNLSRSRQEMYQPIKQLIMEPLPSSGKSESLSSSITSSFSFSSAEMKVQSYHIKSTMSLQRIVDN